MFEVSKFIDDLFNDVFVTSRPSAPEKIHLEVELAGVKKEEITVQVKEGYLSINVDSPRRKGHRGVSLNRQHDIEKADIKFENGLLTVDIPLRKTEEIKGRILEIK